MLLLNILFILLSIYANKCMSTINISSEISTCPTWTHPGGPPHNKCVCGHSIDDSILSCDSDTLTVTVMRYICIFFSDELQTTLVGTCPYGYHGKIPRNVSQIKEGFCFHLHRTGRLCGECEENYTLTVYSYYLGCVKCKSYKNGWLKFIAAAFLPLTLFYILVITIRLSVTSSALNAFVMINQVLAVPLMIRQTYSSNLVTASDHVSYAGQYSIDFIITVFSIWNLDFFRSFYEPGICLSPDLNYQQVLLLEYTIGIYPLFLIFLTYIFVKLHDNFALVVWLWKPFHRCLAKFRRQWNTQSYLIHALATFVILSYVKILNTSFEYLIPSLVFNMEGQSVKKAFWYYNGIVDMTSKDYLPYLILALFMLFVFNILPLLLLALYPFKFFQQFLNCFLPLKFKLALQIFMDTFHGSYKDTTHDYRHFATLYMTVRFLNLLIISVFSFKLYTTAVSILYTFTLALTARFQPYKCKRSNTVDIVLLLAIITAYTSLTMHNIEAIFFPKWLRGIILGLALLIIYCYLVFLILAYIFSKVLQCITSFRHLKRIGKHGNVMNGEDKALLNHEEADLNY